MNFNNKIFKNILTVLFAIVVIIAITNLFIDSGFARPGGGQSYSSGNNSGSGGGDSGLIELIIWLLISLPPEISVPLVIVIIVIYIIAKRRNSHNPQITSAPTAQNVSYAMINVENKIKSLKGIDPNFSKVLFLEFVGSLYQRFLKYQGKKEFSNIVPFLSDAIINDIKSQNLQREINEIVIGQINISEIQIQPEYVSIVVDISANYTMTVNGKSTRYIVSDRWLLNRNPGVHSKEPEKLRKLSCPNCGAPANFTDAGMCNHCETYIKKGEMQWFLKVNRTISLEAFKTQNLLTYTQETGTDYATIVQPGLMAMMQVIESMHKTTWSAFADNFRENIAKAYFLNIYNAWTKQNWESVRHLISDRLWETNLFWINAYKNNGLINKLDSINIPKIEFSRIDFDKYYESITVRIFASCYDYVTNREGKLMAGSNKNPRVFSEYWTFIRKTGLEKEHLDLQSCPNCGAPADKIGQAGVCEYCGAKITTGDFSWILAVITQDEVYKG